MRRKYRETNGIETGVYRERMEYVNQSFDFYFYVSVQFPHEQGGGGVWMETNKQACL